MTGNFKALSILLGYPTAELCEAVDDIRAVLAEDNPQSAEILVNVSPLLESLVRNDLFDLQERYVLLFDRTRSLSLQLFEHVHGESRDRGQAMVDLIDMYRAHGLEVTASELPDHLPLFLEFLSLLPEPEARSLLGNAAHVVAALGERLARRGSDYAGVMKAIEAIAGVSAGANAASVIAAEPDDDPTDLEALDKAWEAEAVRFGPAGEVQDGAACPRASDIVARMGSPMRARDPVPGAA